MMLNPFRVTAFYCWICVFLLLVAAVAGKAEETNFQGPVTIVCLGNKWLNITDTTCAGGDITELNATIPHREWNYSMYQIPDGVTVTCGEKCHEVNVTITTFTGPAKLYCLPTTSTYGCDFDKFFLNTEKEGSSTIEEIELGEGFAGGTCFGDCFASFGFHSIQNGFFMVTAAPIFLWVHLWVGW